MSKFPNLDRLKSQLLTSGLQKDNQPLYQVINQLIDSLRQTINFTESQFTVIESSVGGGGGGPVPGGGFNITSIGHPMPLDGIDGKDGLQGPPGMDGICYNCEPSFPVITTIITGSP